MPTLRYRIFGQKYGSFSAINQSREQFLSQIEDLYPSRYMNLLSSSITLIYAPRAGFTNRLARLNEDADVWANWLVRTSEPADGGLVTGSGTAVAFFNADCPIVCLHQDDRLAVLHAGYRCLMRENPAEEGMIEVAMRHFKPSNVKAFIFGGIGPCCWKPEQDDKPEIKDPALCRDPAILTRCITSTTRHPDGPFLSVDLYELAREILWLCGVPDENIDWDTRCTCCATYNGQPEFWSHTRFQAGEQGGIDGRNMAIAWLE